ncbi:hypothetical protein LCGC14_1193660 [marine sediment metagenome]|uniref:KaiC-like domain-containing protein n=1 Tax=marine sediment metagenome TaxID=412755 RepID=A0A0F9LIW4_9ZZZZ
MLLSIEGDEATGKTTLAYSAPLPIVGFAFDMGIERAIKGGKYEELFAGLEIRVLPYHKGVSYLENGNPSWDGADITIFELPSPIQLDSMRLRGNTDLWLYSINLMAAAFSDPKIATIVVDTMTVARRCKASSHLEVLQNSAYLADGSPAPDGRGGFLRPREQLIQIEYGKVNDSIRDIYTTGAGVKQADGRPKNLIATHHLTDERAPGPTDEQGRETQVLTGKKILEGLAQTHRFVDIALLTTKENKEIKGELKKCGYSLAMEGTIMANPTWDALANLVSMGTGERIELDRRNHS